MFIWSLSDRTHVRTGSSFTRWVLRSGRETGPWAAARWHSPGLPCLPTAFSGAGSAVQFLGAPRGWPGGRTMASPVYVENPSGLVPRAVNFWKMSTLTSNDPPPPKPTDCAVARRCSQSCTVVWENPRSLFCPRDFLPERWVGRNSKDVPIWELLTAAWNFKRTWREGRL